MAEIRTQKELDDTIRKVSEKAKTDSTFEKLAIESPLEAIRIETGMAFQMGTTIVYRVGGNIDISLLEGGGIGCERWPATNGEK